MRPPPCPNHKTNLATPTEPRRRSINFDIRNVVSPALGRDNYELLYITDFWQMRWGRDQSRTRLSVGQRECVFREGQAWARSALHSIVETLDMTYVAPSTSSLPATKDRDGSVHSGQLLTFLINPAAGPERAWLVRKYLLIEMHDGRTYTHSGPPRNV